MSPWLAYALGVLTPAVGVALFYGSFAAYFLFNQWLDRRGWFVEFDGTVGDEWDHGYVRRDILWKRGPFWRGQVVNEGAHRTRFIGFGWRYFGARVGFTKAES